MISLNDYLYKGDTVLKILHNYSADLKASAVREHNAVDLQQSFARVSVKLPDESEVPGDIKLGARDPERRDRRQRLRARA